MSQGVLPFHEVLNQAKSLKRKIISNKLKTAPETTWGSSRNEMKSIIFVHQSKACCILNIYTFTHDKQIIWNLNKVPRTQFKKNHEKEK